MCLFFLLLTSCIGDSYLDVQGTIVSDTSYTDDECRLQLLLQGKNDVVDEIRVEGKFTGRFIVAPKSRRYLIRLLCEGYKPVVRKINYDNSKKKLEKLGVIKIVSE